MMLLRNFLSRNYDLEHFMLIFPTGMVNFQLGHEDIVKTKGMFLPLVSLSSEEYELGFLDPAV